MSNAPKPSQASFNCKFCQKPIYIPLGLPPTTAPCPHCGEKVTSPDLEMLDRKPLPTTMPSEQQPVRLEPSPKEADPTGFAASQAATVERPSAEQAQNAETDFGAASPQKKKGNLIGVVIAAAAILLLAAGVTFWLSNQSGKGEQAGGTTGKSTGASGAATPESQREAWLSSGWRVEASKVLKAFTEADTPEEKMKYVIPNEGVLDELRMYYPAGKKDTLTSADSFSHTDGAPKDKERGIFLMQYRQPAQIDIREYFAPIGSLEAILKQRETTLLEMAHRIDNDNLSDPVGINAFFKEIDGELKLDASVFIQGRYRTFKLFTNYPRPGKAQVFRTVVSETLSHHYRAVNEVRTYRFEDFAYPGDFVTLPVKVDSEIGKVLSQLDWHGHDRARRSYRTATVELEWTQESPSKLVVKRIICWEFLGVGGEEGNTEPQEDSAAKLPVEQAPVAPAE